MNHFSRKRRIVALLSAAGDAALALVAPASAEDTFKLGIVTFLSGPAARYLERKRTGYRAEAAAVSLDGRPAVRLVRAPDAWDRWGRLPEVTAR